MKRLLLSLALLTCNYLFAQPFNFTTAAVHSHNDYEQPIPYWLAYTSGLGSMEADIFLVNGELLVAHERKELKYHRTLEEYYLRNIQQCMQTNNGHLYADTSKSLQLLIDIKTDSVATLNKLVAVLRKYPDIIHNPSLRIVITGNRPPAAKFATYPGFIYFDGVLSTEYPQPALERIALFSDNFKTYSAWNGKGRIPQQEQVLLEAGIKKAHALGKPVRFWNAPDVINAWYHFIHLGVDYINTDHIPEITSFLNNLPATSFKNLADATRVYQPTYKSDDINKAVKNIILLIGDGTGLAQLYAGYTSNQAALSLFNMRQLGLSKTSSYDSYITDSAPGATSMSAGVKTNNRSVGVDHKGTPIPLLPEILHKRNMKTALITCGALYDATPAAFYAHQAERSDTLQILHDLVNAPVELVIGSGSLAAGVEEAAVMAALSARYTIAESIDSIRIKSSERCITFDQRAALHALAGRGEWFTQAFAKTIDKLSRAENGFFIMAEGAQVDHGGHDNNLSYVASEVIDFDKVIGKALEFADQNGETLVIVTADHETGGLTLLDGDFSKGYVSGQFSTNDHTSLPVPVFAYGPRSGLFRGVYENTAIFNKILEALGVQPSR
jgi:alkaline phosphatase